MKIKMLSRPTGDTTRDSKKAVFKVSSNPDPTLHPFERAREVRQAAALRMATARAPLRWAASVTLHCER